jgi:hypothetical protein
MVVCDVQFDDSRMFDLLQHVRNEDHYEKLPFLVIQQKHSVSGVATNGTKATKTTSEVLGAYELIELQNLPEDRAHKLFVEAVGRSFEKTVERERSDTKPGKR